KRDPPKNPLKKKPPPNPKGGVIFFSPPPPPPQRFKLLLFPLLIILAAFLLGCPGNSPSDDTTAPALSNGAVSNLSSANGTTATLSFSSNEAGTQFYVVMPSNIASPNAAAVKTPDSTAVAGSATVSVGANTIAVTGLTAGTQYKAYIIVVDAAGNLSDVLTINGVNPVIEAATYTVTFNSNGGSAVPPATGISSGATVTLPANPTKDSNIFAGWFTDDETFSAAFNGSTPVTDNIIVYAKWTPGTTYTVTFNSNGGSAVAPATGIGSGATVTLPANPTKGSNTFAGWFTDDDTFSTAFNESTPVTGNITVHAKWNPAGGNPFIGIWTGNIKIGSDPDDRDISLVITETAWQYLTLTNYPPQPYGQKGTYVYTGNSATMTITHQTDSGETWSDNLTSLPLTTFEPTVSGNTLTLGTYTLNKMDRTITLNSFPNNAFIKIYLSSSKTSKEEFRAGIVAGASDTIAYGNKVFHRIREADSDGLSSSDWTGTSSYYVFIDGSGGGNYYYVSKEKISFSSDNIIINFTASDWTHLASGDNWSPGS
ncbi:InlB B-repeat-containing protein, partial [Treponema primitia]|uniref:InlB B-repeat-containing protein n=1 Tax=Treponema primitia TaxID=88058 RepID=UPI003981137F